MAIKRQNTTEYRNTTTNTDIWVSRGATPTREGVPFKVRPGKSVFLTDDDIQIQITEGEIKFFTDGSLRLADKVDTLIASEIKIRDDMSELEIKIVIENIKSNKSLALRMRPLTSIATANAIMDECEKQDKPISYLKSCLKKVNALSEKLEIKFKYDEKEERKQERDKLKEALDGE